MDHAGKRLEIKLLGELRVMHDGVRQPLPPSKKTRALLGYLLLTGRRHRRERLCSLFWDVTDDRRGALRWSLSRLRPLVDEPGKPRLAADRDGVGIDLLGAEVDVLWVRRALGKGGGLERVETQALEQYASSFTGEVLEGLELPEFDAFHAFLVAEREEMRRLRARVLSELGARFKSQPERALPYVRSWIQVDPLSLQARTALLQLTHTTGRLEEAAQQYASARRTFQELGSDQVVALEHAWQKTRSLAVRASPAANTPAEEPPARLSYTAVMQPDTGTQVIGRAAEMEELRAALGEVVRTRGPRVLLIAGEPGIGKSHLLEAFARWARQDKVRVMMGAAHEGESGRPYGPLLDSLRGQPNAREPDERDSLLPALTPKADESLDGVRGRLFASAAGFLESRAQGHAALVIIVEDVQWLDAASAELLHYVARSVRGVPILMLLSVRSEELADNPDLARLRRSLRRDRLLSELRLPPLDRDAIAALLEASGSDLDPDRVTAQAGGNPLFALELARVGEFAEDRLPTSLGEAVRERFERLSPHAAEVLRWGSVLDSAFSLRDLEAVSSLDQEQLVSALELLEQGALLRRTSMDSALDGAVRYRFAHDLVRRVVYADLSEPRRQLMHGRMARMLHEKNQHDEDHLVRLVQHATLAHDHALAAEACVAAGQRCRRLFANEQAIVLARRGVHHAERLTGVPRITRLIELLELELWCTPGGREGNLTGRLQALGEQALAEGAVSHARRAFHVLGYFHYERGSLEEAQQTMMRAELVSRAGSPEDQVRSMAEAARCLLLIERDLGRAGALLYEAKARAKQLCVEPAALCDGEGIMLKHRGDFAAAAQSFERAAELASAEQDRLLEYHALEHRTVVALECGDYASARRFCGPLVELSRNLREGSEQPFAAALEALARYAQGESVERLLDASFAKLHGVDAKQRLGHALLLAGELALQRGDALRARAWVQRVPELARVLERPADACVAWAIAARAETRLGRPQAADAARAELARCQATGIWEAARKRVQRLLEES